MEKTEQQKGQRETLLEEVDDLKAKNKGFNMMSLHCSLQPMTMQKKQKVCMREFKVVSKNCKI